MFPMATRVARVIRLAKGRLCVLKIIPRDASEAAVAEIAAVSTVSRCGRLFAMAILLAALSGAALAIDLPVAQYVKSHGLRGELSRLIRLSEVFGWGGTV